MITNLLTAICITASMGANLYNFNNEKPNAPKLMQNDPYNYTLDVVDVNDTYQDVYWNSTAVRCQKDNVAGNNSALFVTGTRYATIPHYSENGNIYVIIGNRDISLRACSIYQITPYNTNLNTETTQTIVTNLTFDQSIVQDDNYTITITKETYTSFDNWSGYINMTNYGSTYFIYNLKNEIVGPESGYRYTEDIQEETITKSTSYLLNTITFETDITMTEGRTMYIATFYHVTIYPNVPQINYGQTTGYYNALRETTFRITGTMYVGGDTEVVDIPGIMFYVLTMPFTFISGAFDLTLFPGTPYQLNISNLFMAIIAVMAFIFILKILIKLKGGAG